MGTPRMMTVFVLGVLFEPVVTGTNVSPAESVFVVAAVGAAVDDSTVGSGRLVVDDGPAMVSCDGRVPGSTSARKRASSAATRAVAASRRRRFGSWATARMANAACDAMRARVRARRDRAA
jgi:hypothetical protein